MILNPFKSAATGLKSPVAAYLLCVFILLLLNLPTDKLFAEGANTPFTDTIGAILREYRISQEDIERVEPVCGEAEGAEIPLEMLIPRIREAMAKGIPVPKLVEALRGDIKRLIQARDIILRIPQADTFLQEHKLWQRTANLSAAGISSGVIGSLIEMSSTDPEVYQPVTGLYVALTRWGLSEIQGLRLVQSIVRSDLDPGEYPQVASLFSRARQSPLAPEELIRRMESELPKVKTLRQLEGRILE